MKERTKHIVVKIKGCCFFVKRLLSNTDSHFQTGKEKKKKKTIVLRKKCKNKLNIRFNFSDHCSCNY